MSTADDFKAALQKHAKVDDGAFLQGFFKTGEGQYGEGDIFIGVRVPMTRTVCKTFKDLPLDEIDKLLASPIHEHRLAAVILLSNQFAKADDRMRKAIFETYMRGLRGGRINNWDIVDVSAEYVVGEYLRDKPRDLLFELAASDDIWRRRAAMVGTFAFIKKGDPSTSLLIAEKLLHDKHDLIQKAVGWMLREIGKRVDRAVLLQFLDEHAHVMPRTMLRYSIEHLPPGQRQHYLGLRQTNSLH
jgi:3-methyladenine DNA glycosylase AlkD